MNTLKNIDIAREYNISSSTVTRWIQLQAEGKNNLQLFEKNGKLLIIDNAHNRAEIVRLVEEGKKYRSNIDCKRTSPDKQFYNSFSPEEQIEIVNDLEYRQDINLKFSYKDGGAVAWDKFYLTNTSPITVNVNDLLSVSIDDLNYYLNGINNINLIDIGSGNGYPLREFINSLKKKNGFNSIVLVDISKELSDIASSNIGKWFEDTTVLSYVKDLETDNFSKIFFENKSKDILISNVVTHIGNTICNIDDRVLVLKNLRKGLSSEDFLIISYTLDNVDTRSTLNYQKVPEQFHLQHWIPEIIGIDTENCEIKLEFDEIYKVKRRSLVLDKDYVISFDLFNKPKIIELHSGQSICTWKHYVLTVEEILNELKLSSLKPVSIKLDRTKSTGLFICKAQ